MKSYMGFCQCADGSGGNLIQVMDGTTSRALDPRFDLRNHSPTGFNWGYGGSGPAQTAIALLADALGDDDRAQRLYQRFKFKVVAGWKSGLPWSIGVEDIKRICAEIETAAADAGMAR